MQNLLVAETGPTWIAPGAPGDDEVTLAEYWLQPPEPETFPFSNTAVIAGSAGAGFPSSSCARTQLFPARASMDVPPFPLEGCEGAAAPGAAGGAAQPK